MQLRKVTGKIAEGAYALIFFEGDRAVKVFKRRNDAPESHVRSVFESEISAYALARDNPKTKAAVSHFIGPTSCSQIFDAGGIDVSECFFLDCAYEMKRITDPLIKFGALPAPSKESIFHMFAGSGIGHIVDCSASVAPDGTVLHVIDFATREFELEHAHQ